MSRADKKTRNCTAAAAGLLLALAAISLLLVVPAYSYLPQGSGSASFTLDKWSSTPIPIAVSTNIAAGAKLYGSGYAGTNFYNVIQSSLATWNQAPNFQSPLGAVSQNTFSAPVNGINLICFCSNTGGVNFSGDGTLAITVSTYIGNQITGANIFFNPQPSGVCWATDNTVVSCSSSGDPNSGDVIQDLQTVATHEIGHFIGLDHSAVVRATMFPYAPAIETELSWDDVAGASLLYPKSVADVATGAISGTVTLNSSAVFGAHVFANSTSTTDPFSTGFPNIRKSPIGMLTDPFGNYKIQGLPPDSYVVYAEPLDGPVTSSNVNWAADYGQSALQTNFTTRFY